MRSSGRVWTFGAAAGACSSLLAAQQAPAPAIPPAPPVIVAPAPSAFDPRVAQQAMVIWHASAATCDGKLAAPVRAPNPLPSLSWAPPAQAVPMVGFAFAIDATGRTRGITRGEQRYFGDDMDLAPALAATRFTPGAAQGNCAISFTAERVPLSQVPIDMAMAYSVFPSSNLRPAALWQRIQPPGSTCFRPGPSVLNRAFPDFKALPGEPGRPLWSMVGFDIDAAGKPVRVRTVTGSQSAPLDAAARRAIEQSRFGKEARQGCLYPYWKSADPLPAPEMPARDDFPKSAACEALGEWVRKPVLAYPNTYRRRGIEGWAIVSYDVAPWGATGNVKVIAAQPSADFGEAGLSTIRAATKASSATGAAGCVERVRFVMNPVGKPPAAGAGEQAAPLY